MVGAATRIDAAFGIHKGERPMVLLLLLQYFFIGIATGFTQTAGFALFLGAFGAEDLPYTYMLMAVIFSPMTLAYFQAQKSLSFPGLLTLNFAAQIIIPLRRSDQGVGTERRLFDRPVGPLHSLSAVGSAMRTRAQTFANGLAQPLSTGIAGASLLALGSLFPGSSLPLMIGLVALGAALLAIVLLAGRDYSKALLEALHKRRLSAGSGFSAALPFARWEGWATGMPR